MARSNNYNMSAREKARIQRLLQVRKQEKAASAATIRKYRARKEALEQGVRSRAEHVAAEHLEAEQHRLDAFRSNADRRIGQAHADALRHRRQAQAKARRDQESWECIDSLARQRAHEASYTRKSQPHYEQRERLKQHQRERLGVTERYAHVGRQRAQRWRVVANRQKRRSQQLHAASEQRGPEILGRDVKVSVGSDRMQDFSSSRMHVRTVAHNKGLRNNNNGGSDLNLSPNHSRTKMALATGDGAVHDAMAAAREVRERNRRRNEAEAEKRLRAAERALARGLGALRKIKARDELPETMELLASLDKVDRLNRAEKSRVSKASADGGRRVAFEEQPAHKYPVYVSAELNARGSETERRNGRSVTQAPGHAGDESDDQYDASNAAEGESDDERMFEQAFMQDQERQQRYQDLLFRDRSTRGDDDMDSTRSQDSSDPSFRNDSELDESDTERLDTSRSDRQSEPAQVQHWFGVEHGDHMLLQRNTATSPTVHVIPTTVQDATAQNTAGVGGDSVEYDDAPPTAADVDLADLDRQLSENADWWKHFAATTRELADADDE